MQAFSQIIAFKKIIKEIIINNNRKIIRNKPTAEEVQEVNSLHHNASSALKLKDQELSEL